MDDKIFGGRISRSKIRAGDYEESMKANQIMTAQAGKMLADLKFKSEMRNNLARYGITNDELVKYICTESRNILKEVHSSENTVDPHEFISICNLEELGTYFYNYLGGKYHRKDKLDSIVLFKLMDTVRNCFSGAAYNLLIADYHNSIIMARPLYESYLVYMLISENRSLIMPFLDHSSGKMLEIIVGSQEKHNEVEAYILDETKTYLKAKFEQLKEKYGEKYFRDYGWADKIVKSGGPDGLVSLIDIARHLGLENRDVYRISNAFLHTTSLSWMYDESEIKQLGLAIVNESADLMVNCLIKFIKDIGCVESDMLQMCNALEKLREEIKGAIEKNNTTR